MTLDEAIEVLKTFHDQAACHLDATSANAFQLGIEALKQILWQRKEIFADKIRLLPGETNET